MKKQEVYSMKRVVIASSKKDTSPSRKAGYDAGVKMLKNHKSLMEGLKNK